MNVLQLRRTEILSWPILLILIAGCDERIAKISREAADRQAEQNRSMANLQQEVAAGTKLLVEADAQARRDLLAAHEDLHTERSRLDQGRDALELDRKQLSAQRRTESLLVPILQSLGAVALVVVVIGFAWYALVRLRSDEAVDAELVELLVHELTDDRIPRLPADPTPQLAQSQQTECLTPPPSIQSDSTSS